MIGNKTTYFLLCCIYSINSLFAQNDSVLTASSPAKHSLIKKVALPATFILSGVIINKSVFEREFNRDLRNQVGNDFHSSIDDYLQYVPIAEMYIADGIGIEAKNHWFDQTKNLVISNVVTGIIVHSIKRGMNKTRPNNSPYSFPSGHTATAFTGATVLYQEFKTSSPVLAYSGFGFAAATGSFRMINNVHWLSDVLAGAGISIMVTNLVYHIEPLKNFNPFKESKDISMFPYFNENETGIYFSKKF